MDTDGGNVIRILPADRREHRGILHPLSFFSNHNCIVCVKGTGFPSFCPLVIKKKNTAKGKRGFWFSPQGLVLLCYVLMLWSTRLAVAAELFGTKAGHAEPTVQAPRHQGQVEVWPPHSMLTGQGASQTPPSCCCNPPVFSASPPLISFLTQRKQNNSKKKKKKTLLKVLTWTHIKFSCTEPHTYTTLAVFENKSPSLSL